MKKLLLALAFTLLLPMLGEAQTVNPTRAEFTASGNHATAVSNYVLEVVKDSDSSLVASSDLGKPTPNASNLVNVPLPAGLPNNTVLRARVKAVGVGGSRTSGLSAPFVVAEIPDAPGVPVLKIQ